MARVSESKSFYGKLVVRSAIVAGLLFAAPQLAFAADASTVAPSSQDVTETQVVSVSKNSTANTDAAGVSATDSGKLTASTAAKEDVQNTQTSDIADTSTSSREQKSASNEAASLAPKESTSRLSNATKPSGSEEVQTDAVGSSAALGQAAKTGEKSYSSLSDAINACFDGQTVTLLGDIKDLSQRIVIAGKSIVIDGAGHKLERSKGYAGEFFNVEKGAGLTLRNIILDGGGDGWYIDYANGDIRDKVGGISRVPIAKGTASVNSTGRMITNQGNLILDKSVLENAYSTKVGGVLVYSATGSKLCIVGGTVLRNSYSDDAPVLVGGGCNFLVDGATFNGLASGGGALHILSDATDTMPVIKHAKFLNCFSGFNGGSLYCARNAVEVSDSTFENSTTCNDGGSVCMTPGVVKTPLRGATSTFKNVSFINSRGLSTYNQSLGSAVFLHQTYGGAYVFENCSFRGCVGCEGTVMDIGYGRLGEEKEPMPMSYYHCTFEGNKAGDSVAIDIRNADVRLDDCRLVNNEGNQAGAIGMEGNANCTLGKGTVVSNNSAVSYGGGIRFWGDNTFTMEPGSKLFGNTAGKGGDDIYSGNASTYAPRIVLLRGSDMGASTRDGYTIDGWYLDVPEGAKEGAGRYERNVSDEQTQLVIHTNEMIALKADASTFLVKYEPNAEDAKGSMEDDEFGRADGASFAKSKYSRNGWRFLGWALSSNGQVLFQDCAQIPSYLRKRGAIVSVYAVWERASTPETKKLQPNTQQKRLDITPACFSAAKKQVARADTSKAIPATGDESSAASLMTAFFGGLVTSCGFAIRRKHN